MPTPLGASNRFISGNAKSARGLAFGTWDPPSKGQSSPSQRSRSNVMHKTAKEGAWSLAWKSSKVLEQMHGKVSGLIGGDRAQAQVVIVGGFLRDIAAGAYDQ